MINKVKEEHRLHKHTQEGVREEGTGSWSLNALRHLKIAYIPYNELLKEGFMAGIGWSFGVTVGFVIISSVLVLVLRSLGGLPLIGSWIATVVEATQSQLIRRTLIIPQ